MRTKFYSDDRKVAETTAAIIAAGDRIFEVYRLGRDDQSHVRELLRFMTPLSEARILDAGCGVGAVSDLMLAERPDLSFVLLNISPSQLNLCSGRRVAADFDALPFANSSFDVVMFNYALGHADLDKAIGEASRALSGNGVLFIYDVIGDDPNCLSELEYRCHPIKAVFDAARRNGFHREMAELPAHNADQFISLFGAREFQRLFGRTHPIIYRFEK